MTLDPDLAALHSWEGEGGALAPSESDIPPWRLIVPPQVARPHFLAAAGQAVGERRGLDVVESGAKGKAD